MNQDISGMRVAILVTDGFEQTELTEPRKALEAAGAVTTILANQSGQVQGFHHRARADSFTIDRTFGQADPDEFDAVLLPGGRRNGERIRAIPAARDFVESFHSEGKPIAAICHGVALLVSAGLVAGRRLTGASDLKADVEEAGGHWIDEAAVVDGNLVTSRGPHDLPAFNEAVLEVFARVGSDWTRAREGSLRRQHPGDQVV